MLKGNVEFLKRYGRKDCPDMDESIVELLKNDHFYYIDDNLQGYFIPKNVSMLSESDEVLHEYFKENAE